MSNPELTDILQRALPHALADVELPFLGAKIPGKVRNNYRIDDRRVLVVTDRLSAFDRILGLVPFKGQVLNQLAAFWFEQTADIVPNHFIAMPDPNVTVAHECRPLAVEVVVRGYITGVTGTALWTRYSQGERHIYGMDFPDGLRKNDALPEPIITPTTKAGPDDSGGHDERITSAEVVEKGLVPADQWAEICAAAIALFKRGQEIARRGGLILVDTKYEFGIGPASGSNSGIMLMDEMHTPDSSRFWIADTYAARHAAGQEPENFDKEFVRLWYADHGYRGEGEPPAMPPELAVAAAERYIRAYEMITGRTFEPGDVPAGPRIEQNMRKWLNA